MMIPQDVGHEIYCMERQSEAVAIYLAQQDQPVARRMLKHKIDAIHTYIQYLEAHNDQEESSED